MKQFFKMTLATICGIAIFITLTGLFMMISLVGMLASESASTKVKENSVFVIKLNGTISERIEAGNPLNTILGMGDMSEMGLDDLIASIRKAKDNENIKGIYLEGGEASFDAPASAQQLRDALKDFKTSGKWIVAYADLYYQTNYYVATVADNIYLNGQGTIDFKGLGGKGEYMKGLYDKLGIKYLVAKVGKYKSYVERNTLTGMSDYDREQREAYLTGIWSYWLKEMAEGRKVKVEDLNQLANDSIMMFADNTDYVKAKLVDKVIFPEEIKAEIKKRLKLEKDDDINQLTLSDIFATGYEQPLKDVLLKALKAKTGCTTLTALRNKGYLYSMDIFPSENFILGEETITFVYNPYEIAPYAMGSTELIIPYSDVDKILKTTFDY